jgi:hypothetical protein
MVRSRVVRSVGGSCAVLVGVVRNEEWSLWTEEI